MTGTENDNPPRLFDRALLGERLQRATRLGPATFLLDRVAEDMAERLHAVLREFSQWRGSRHARRSGAQRDRCGCSATCSSRSASIRQRAVAAWLPNPSIWRSRHWLLQFVNDLPGVLAQVRRALKPDGLLLAAMIGGDTLTELRQSFAAAEAEVEGGVSPRVAPFADLRDIGALLQRAGFALPVTDVDRIVVRYDNAFALMHDLRRMGATNISDRAPPDAVAPERHC